MVDRYGGCVIVFVVITYTTRHLRGASTAVVRGVCGRRGEPDRVGAKRVLSTGYRLETLGTQPTIGVERWAPAPSDRGADGWISPPV